MKRIMYLWTLVLAAMMAFTFTACGDDNDDEPATSESDFVGTWSVQESTGYGITVDDFEYLQLKSDGTCIDVQEDEDNAKGYFVQYGKWTASDNKLIIQPTTGPLKGSTFSYDIIKKDKNRMTVSMLGITAYLVKVSDSIIDKYLYN